MPGPVLTEEKAAEAVAAETEFVSGIRLIKLLAKGGFAEVWQAEQTSLGRRIAVKILREELLDQAPMVELFEQEAKVLARLNHPNVVQVIDRGTSSRGPYFVMEFVEGKTLQDMLTRNTLSRDRALTILLQATRGLAYAHRNRVVHRDVKPANILVSRAGQVKLSDFGIAAVKRAVGEDVEETEGQKRTALGTRAFMAPEQRISFDDVGTEADVYSLGVILHRIVTGKLPAGPGRVAPGVSIPERILPVIEKALSASPGRRYQNAGAFRESLVNALEGRHIEAQVRRGAANALGAGGRFELLDVIRQDERRSVYLVRKGGPEGEQIVVKRYMKDAEALRTVRNLMRVESPHIIRILAVGEREDAFIMLMEHMPGGDLRERLVKPHPWREVAAVGEQVALALAAAHRHGVVHGNVRPSNILFASDGTIRVTDFGLPEHYAGEPGKRNWYAAPERERGPAADVYALGAILYEMLFASPIPEASRDLFREAGSCANLPDAFQDLFRSMLAPAESRNISAEVVARELRLLLEGGAKKAEEAIVEDAVRAIKARPRKQRRGGATHLPGLLGVGALALAWLLEQPFFEELLVDLLGRF